MDISLMLASNRPSFLVIEQRKNTDVVLGVPHHAPAGTPKLPCPDHQVADENAGFLGRYIAEKLDCCSIVACNYTIDVNKHAQTDYSVQIAKWKPKVLIEIHGHGGTKAKHDVEISSGSSDNDKYSNRMATKLRDLLANDEELKNISIGGQYAELYFKASESVTITNGGWVAYHIELPPKLRKRLDTSSGEPPKMGYRFCDAVIATVKEMHGV